jgi:hypothetical protein
MERIFRFILLAILLGVPLVAQCDVASKGRTACVLGICLPTSKLDENAIVKRFGEGFPIRDGKVTARCFAYSANKAFVHFKFARDGKRLSEVFLSRAPNCYAEGRPVEALPQLAAVATARNQIMLGDPKERVSRLLGTPSKKEPGTGLNVVGMAYEAALRSKDMGDELWFYSHDGTPPFEGIYLKDGRVVAIWITASP